MTTFVLVPGAGPVAPLLRDAGHAVWSATGDVDAVTAMLEERDLSDVVLVGHAGGSRAIAGVADRAPRRVAQLVFVDDGADAVVSRASAGDRTRWTYVHCTQARPAPRIRFGEPGWEVTDLPAGSRPLDEAPDLVAALLEGLAAR